MDGASRMMVMGKKNCKDLVLDGFKGAAPLFTLKIDIKAECDFLGVFLVALSL